MSLDRGKIVKIKTYHELVSSGLWKKNGSILERDERKMRRFYENCGIYIPDDMFKYLGKSWKIDRVLDSENFKIVGCSYTFHISLIDRNNKFDNKFEIE